MAVITLASTNGSPGVTTTALGLALNWPRDVLLADCDRLPSQTLQAGYLCGVDLAGRGLGQLARAHREGRSLPEELWLQTVELSSGSGHERHLLPGFTHPGAPGIFAPIWGQLCDALDGLGESGRDVVVDAGRIGNEGLPTQLVDSSDLLLVCVRSSLRALAGLRLHLPTLQNQLAQSAATAELALLVVGASRPYSSGEITRQFGVPVVHDLAWEPRQAAVLSDGDAPARSWGGGALNRSYRACASAVDERVRRRREVVSGERSVAEWAAR